MDFSKGDAQTRIDIIKALQPRHISITEDCLQDFNIDLFIENFASFTFLETFELDIIKVPEDIKYQLTEIALKAHPSLKSLIVFSWLQPNLLYIPHDAASYSKQLSIFQLLENNNNLTSIDIGFRYSNQQSFDGFVNAIMKNSTLTNVVIRDVSQNVSNADSVNKLLTNNKTIKDFSFINIFMSFRYTRNFNSLLSGIMNNTSLSSLTISECNLNQPMLNRLAII